MGLVSRHLGALISSTSFEPVFGTDLHQTRYRCRSWRSGWLSKNKENVEFHVLNLNSALGWQVWAGGGWGLGEGEGVVAWEGRETGKVNLCELEMELERYDVQIRTKFWFYYLSNKTDHPDCISNSDELVNCLKKKHVSNSSWRREWYTTLASHDES